jgi:hypothetical protein
MYTGKLIADLFEAVKRAEDAAAELCSSPKTKQEEVVVGGSSYPHRKEGRSVRRHYQAELEDLTIPLHSGQE